MGVKLGLRHKGRNIDRGCLRTIKNNQVEEHEVGGACSTNEGEEESV
jgi:hypothetical protein